MVLEKLANVEDIPEGNGIVVQSKEGVEIALFKVDGKVFALENSCPHMGGPLGEGDLEGCVVTCPWHGWQFDVTTGECANMPGDEAAPIAITVDEGVVYLTRG